MGKNRATRPTRAQKEAISNAGLIVKNWLVIKDTLDKLVLVSRGSGRTRTIKKPQAGRPGAHGPTQTKIYTYYYTCAGPKSQGKSRLFGLFWTRSKD